MNPESKPFRRPLPQLGCAAGQGNESTDAANAEPGVVRPDAALISQGWVRRHMVGPERVQEWTDLYESLGFAVKLRPLTPDDFGATCRQCAATCDACFMIYTRSEWP